MEIKANVGLHNKFVIEVRDAETGELKQTATSYNIILDQMYTRLCGGSTYFVNIHFGTGTGTLSPSRTSLFTHLGTKAAVDEAQVKGIPNSSWTRKIVINPEEFVGSTFREVGIAFGATTTNLVTHSLLRDSEGAPLEITKTATDVITIYATVFVVLNTDNLGIEYLRVDQNNQLVNYLVGGASAPTGTLRLNDQLNAVPSLGETAAVTWTADVASRKRSTNTVRFGTTVANGHVKYLEMNNFFSYAIPISGVYEGTPYLGVSLGVGDGVNKKFVLPSRHIRLNTLIPRLNGIGTASYTLNTFKSPFRAYTLLTGSVGIAARTSLSTDGKVVAQVLGVNSGTTISTPRLRVYDILANGAHTLRPIPPGLPIDVVSTFLKLSSNGNTVGVTFLGVYYSFDWTGGAWVPRAPLPFGVLSASDDLNTVCSSSASAPWLAVYRYVAGSWVSINFGVSPPTSAAIPFLSGDGLVLISKFTSNTSFWTYKLLNGVFDRVSTTNTGESLMQDASISYTGDTFVITHFLTNASRFHVYKSTDGVTYSRKTILNDTSPAIQARGCCVRPDGKYAMYYTQSSGVSFFYEMGDGNWSFDYTINGLSTDTGSSNMTEDGDLFCFTWGYFKRFTHYEVVFDTPPAADVVVTADYTVDGIHKTDQYVVDASFAIQFGEIV